MENLLHAEGFMHTASYMMEVLGVAVILGGTIWASFLFVRDLVGRDDFKKSF